MARLSRKQQQDKLELLSSLNHMNNCISSKHAAENGKFYSEIIWKNDFVDGFSHSIIDFMRCLSKRKIVGCPSICDLDFILNAKSYPPLSIFQFHISIPPFTLLLIQFYGLLMCSKKLICVRWTHERRNANKNRKITTEQMLNISTDDWSVLPQCLFLLAPKSK